MQDLKRRPDETEIGSFERDGLKVVLTVVAAWSQAEWYGVKLYISEGRKRVYYLTVSKDGERWRQAKDLSLLDAGFPRARQWIETQVKGFTNGKA